ncbi:hypothetical protein FHW69_003807 [Luteibacter sp. Sphag1AF]|nr:hypothetical protein [Luteibacter sp. Sphag1AF]
MRDDTLERIVHERKTPLGLTGIAGTLMLLDATLQLNHAPAVANATRDLLGTRTVVDALERLDSSVSRGQAMRVTASPQWILLLGIARSAQSSGHVRIQQVCSRILSSELLADAIDDRLFRLLMWIAPGSNVSGQCVRAECSELLAALLHANPASQYGLGALLGILQRSGEHIATDDSIRRDAAACYVRRIDDVLRAARIRTAGGAALCDMARGMSGFALRMANLHGRQSMPATVLF